MRVTTVSGTPEELISFFNKNQAVPLAKERKEAIRQGYIGKWTGSAWDSKSRQVDNAGDLNSPEIDEIIRQILS